MDREHCPDGANDVVENVRIDVVSFARGVADHGVVVTRL